MNEKAGSRTLEIDGEIVVFEIGVANNSAAVREAGRIPRPRPFLGYRLLRAGEIAREGVLTEDVGYPGTVSDQFTDDALAALYRKAMQRS